MDIIILVPLCLQQIFGQSSLHLSSQLWHFRYLLSTYCVRDIHLLLCQICWKTMSFFPVWYLQSTAGDKTEKLWNIRHCQRQDATGFIMWQVRSLIHASTAQYLSCGLSCAFLGNMYPHILEARRCRFIRCCVLGSVEALLPSSHLTLSWSCPPW